MNGKYYVSHWQALDFLGGDFLSNILRYTRHTSSHRLDDKVTYTKSQSKILGYLIPYPCVFYLPGPFVLVLKSL